MVSSRQAIACILLSLAVAVCAHAQSPAKEQTVSISGKVTFKNKGLAGIVVVAMPNGGSHTRPRYRATTDEEGNYRISDVTPGSYVTYPLAPALVVDKADSTTELTIRAGESITDVNFAMVRGGVITGQVTNRDGQPLVEESVMVTPVEPSPYPSYNFQGFHTDDRGIYRAFGLRPGKYRVSVGKPKALPLHVQKATRQTFYPSVTEIDKATVIEVTDGSEATDINIVVAGVYSTFTVSGRIIDSAGAPVPGALLGIQQRDGNSTMSTTGGTATNSKGEFKMQDVLPGKYTLFFASPQNSDLRADPIEIEVIDSDLTGLEFKTKRGASLSGMVVLEGVYEKPLAAALFKGLQVYVWFDSPTTDFATGLRAVEVGPDGSFRIVGVGSGNAHLDFMYGDNSDDRKFEIQHLEHNGMLLPNGISIKEGEQVAGVRMVVKHLKLTGGIRGLVKIENGELAPNARIMVWVNSADASRTSRNSTHSPQVDARGQFRLDRLAAGTYDVRAAVVEPGGRRLGPASPKQLVVVADNAVTDVTVTIKLKP